MSLDHIRFGFRFGLSLHEFGQIQTSLEVFRKFGQVCILIQVLVQFQVWVRFQIQVSVLVQVHVWFQVWVLVQVRDQI